MRVGNNVGLCPELLALILSVKFGCFLQRMGELSTPSAEGFGAHCSSSWWLLLSFFFPRTSSKHQRPLQTPPNPAWASPALLLPHSPWLFVFSSVGELESWLRHEHHIKKVHMKPIQFFPRTLHARIQPQTVIPINMHIPAFPITKSERLGLSALQEISSPHCPLLSATH